MVDVGEREARDALRAAAPRRASARRHSEASSQPWVATRPPRTSMPTTTRSGPCAASAARSISGSVIAAVPITTRSAPALQRLLDRLGRAQAAAVLHRHAGLGGDPPQVLDVHRLAGPRAVEVDDVQALGAAAHPCQRGRQRVGVIDGARAEVARCEPHGAAFEDVDRRVEPHRWSAQDCAIGRRSGRAAVAVARRRSPRSCRASAGRPPRTSRGGTGRRRRSRAARRSRTARRTRPCRARPRRRRAPARASARGRRRSAPAGRARAASPARAARPRSSRCAAASAAPARSGRTSPRDQAEALGAAHAPARSRRRAACRGRCRAAACPRARRSRSSSSRPSRLRFSIAFGNAPTPGQHEPGGVASRVGVRAQQRPRADVRERLLDRAAVAHPVVDDADLDAARAPTPQRRAHDVSVPFVLGTPGSVGSIATACAQRARERLEGRLDHVVGVAARLDAQVQRQLGRVGERAEELLGQLVLEAAGRARRQRRLEDGQRAPRDVDRAARPGLVHRHRRRRRSG